MINVNKICLIGRAGSDPNTRFFDSGSVKSAVGIAVNRPSKKYNDPDWFNLIFWGKTAETAEKYVRKGSQIGVSGSLIQEKWIDKQTGEERSAWKVKVDRLTLLGSSKDTEEDDSSEE